MAMILMGHKHICPYFMGCEILGKQNTMLKESQNLLQADLFIFLTIYTIDKHIKLDNTAINQDLGPGILSKNVLNILTDNSSSNVFMLISATYKLCFQQQNQFSGKSGGQIISLMKR